MLASSRERLDQHDREIAAIRKMILAGTRLVNRSGQLATRNEQQIKELVAAQKATDKTLKAFIASFSKAGNGKLVH